MFTRQHYKAIAEIIKDSTIDYKSHKTINRSVLLTELAIYFAQDNPSFNQVKFLKACRL